MKTTATDPAREVGRPALPPARISDTGLPTFTQGSGQGIGTRRQLGPNVSPRRSGLPGALPLVGICCLMSAALFAVSPAAGPRLIPQATQVTWEAGTFELTERTPVLLPPNCPTAAWAAAALNRHLAMHGFQVRVQASSEKPARRAIQLRILSPTDPQLGEEGYQLAISGKGVVLAANQPAGLFYGVQTLAQLLPAPAKPAPSAVPSRLELPGVRIVDTPRFGWRGLLLDVSRHFFTTTEVKASIETMALFKFNHLQLHLTDDQGWRLEVKARPQLTAVGAWRVPRQGNWWSYDPPLPGEAATDGGFFTQAEIRDLVAFACERFITLVPEIETPGHSLATLAAYPELSCGGGPFQVNPGSRFYGRIENTLCPGNDATFAFLDQVIGEVAGLFPGTYIHIGGDEAFHGFWGKCPKCKQRMVGENLKSLAELQSYFVKRVEKIVESKGKRLIGWDEILDGGLAPNATVMSWRGTAGAETASKLGHLVVLSPSSHYYLDLYQGDPALESSTYSQARLREVYQFEPVPASVSPQLVLGIQGNLWTESIPTLRQAQYMTWPRALAIAESAWSAPVRKDWPEFFSRAEVQMERLTQAGINCARSVYDPIVTPKKDAEGFLVLELSSELEEVSLHYTFATANPDPTYPAYQAPLRIPRNAAEIRVVSVRHGRAVGRQLNLPIPELVKRLGTACKLYPEKDAP
ncbi:MAG: family 20 glycosylhydrolase [Verrucomicrobiales bacterium]|nr:family 20 glycosylhydrolase [Verrucomicrobiales bacterium]